MVQKSVLNIFSAEVCLQNKIEENFNKSATIKAKLKQKQRRILI